MKYKILTIIKRKFEDDHTYLDPPVLDEEWKQIEPYLCLAIKLTKVMGK